jgi:hypothetical protein
MPDFSCAVLKGSNKLINVIIIIKVLDVIAAFRADFEILFPEILPAIRAIVSHIKTFSENAPQG